MLFRSYCTATLAAMAAIAISPLAVVTAQSPPSVSTVVALDAEAQHQHRQLDGSGSHGNLRSELVAFAAAEGVEDVEGLGLGVTPPAETALDDDHMLRRRLGQPSTEGSPVLVEGHGTNILEPSESAQNEHSVSVSMDGAPPSRGGEERRKANKGPRPISNREMGPGSSQLKELMFNDVDFSLPVPDGVEIPDDGNKRSLQSGRVTTWVCFKNNWDRVRAVRIWWGHEQKNAIWACSNWAPEACSGDRCIAYQVETSQWNCYRSSDNRFIDRVEIWWGHGVGDGIWACNNWVSGCRNGGGCMVTGGAWDDCNALAQTDGCSAGLEPARSGLKEACDQHDYCYYGPVREGFRQGYVACSYLFINRAKELGAYVSDAQVWFDGMMMDPLNTSGNIAGPGFGNAYQDQQLKSEKDCYLGRSVPYEGYTTPCWGTNTRCLAGTTCYNCCNGDRWVWEWFGHHCN